MRSKKEYRIAALAVKISLLKQSKQNCRGKYCSRTCANKATSQKHDIRRTTLNRRLIRLGLICAKDARTRKLRNYPQYGAVGIAVCEHWDVFANFLEDMGERPKGMTIDRVDGTKGYYKENCQWKLLASNNKTFAQISNLPTKAKLNV